MIKLGIDVHGVADTNPHLFSELSRLLVENGHEVHILTGAERTEELEYEIRNILCLSFTHFFSTTSYHKKIGTEITYIDGNPYMDNKIWNRAKAEYCRKFGISLHIDDSDVYGKYFKTPYARFEQNHTEDESDIDDLIIDSSVGDTTSTFTDGYKNPSISIDIVISSFYEGSLRILLVKRNRPPFKGKWALPGGLVQIESNEDLDAVAARKVKEKTGLSLNNIEQLKTYGDAGRDPRARVLTTAYYSIVSRDIMCNSINSEKAEETMWFPVQDIEKNSLLKSEKLAFDHSQIVSDFKKNLKKKLLLSPVAFEFLGNSFTWTELLSVYEATLEKKIDLKKFKKYIMTNYKIKELENPVRDQSRIKQPVLLNFEGEKDNYL